MLLIFYSKHPSLLGDTKKFDIKPAAAEKLCSVLTVETLVCPRVLTLPSPCFRQRAGQSLQQNALLQELRVQSFRKQTKPVVARRNS